MLFIEILILIVSLITLGIIVTTLIVVRGNIKKEYTRVDVLMNKVDQVVDTVKERIDKYFP